MRFHVPDLRMQIVRVQVLVAALPDRCIRQSKHLPGRGWSRSRADFGSSLIRFGTSKQVSHRQIDFRGDSQHGAAALPHEMTHVVLADLLGGCQPPRWADEGMAILADPQNKQQLHQRDVQAAQASRLAFRAVELLTIDQYPHPSRVPAFYGQSASLTAFLVEHDDPATFVSFLRDAVSLGYGHDAALREHYDIDNVAALEKLWHKDRTTRLGKVSLASHNEANTSQRRWIRWARTSFDPAVFCLAVSLRFLRSRGGRLRRQLVPQPVVIGKDLVELLCQVAAALHRGDLVKSFFLTAFAEHLVLIECSRQLLLDPFDAGNGLLVGSKILLQLSQVFVGFVEIFADLSCSFLHDHRIGLTRIGCHIALEVAGILMGRRNPASRRS